MTELGIALFVTIPFGISATSFSVAPWSTSVLANQWVAGFALSVTNPFGVNATSVSVAPWLTSILANQWVSADRNIFFTF